MAASRPFASLDAAGRAADDIWASLDRDDWLEAFAAHPRIGDRPRSAWETGEQSGVGDSAALRARFEKMNRDYEARFGYIFIVCATGKSAEEMLDILERRVRNSPDDELREAAEAQRQITRLRLAKLTA
jgi:OHCU decarboxylase